MVCHRHPRPTPITTSCPIWLAPAFASHTCHYTCSTRTYHHQLPHRPITINCHTGPSSSSAKLAHHHLLHMSITITCHHNVRLSIIHHRPLYSLPSFPSTITHQLTSPTCFHFHPARYTTLSLTLQRPSQGRPNKSCPHCNYGSLSPVALPLSVAVPHTSCWSRCRRSIHLDLHPNLFPEQFREDRTPETQHFPEAGA